MLMFNVIFAQDCFIVDTGASGVFVWVGKQATREERGSSMVKAEGFLAAKGHADWTPITRVIEGAETPIFKSAFAKWNYAVPKSMLNPGAAGCKYMKYYFYDMMIPLKPKACFPLSRKCFDQIVIDMRQCAKVSVIFEG